MNFLAAYSDSDSDNDNEENVRSGSSVATAAPVVSAVPVATPSSSSVSSKPAGGKKMLTLDMSIYPPHIQKLLSKGSSLQDSDSDSDADADAGGPHRERLTIKSVSAVKGISLMAQLPRPREGAVSADTTHTPSAPVVKATNKPTAAPFVFSSTVTSSRSGANGASASAIDIHSGRTSSPAATASSSGNSHVHVQKRPASTVGGDSDSGSGSDSDSDSGARSAPPVAPRPAAVARVSLPATARSAPLTAAPTVVAPAPPAFYGPSLSLSAAAGPALGPAAGPPVGCDYSNYYPDPSAYVAADGAPNLSEDFPDGAVPKRQRQRQLENQFMAGNLNAIGAGAAPTFRPQQQWDSSVYLAQQQLEAQSRAKFATGKGGSAAMPTKNQSRKHQINSLAAQAADMELIMLENQGKRTKSKSETQMKYGW
jgi:hypothetical protein